MRHLNTRGLFGYEINDQFSTFQDGRLATGDQLLSVDGQSLVGISQEE